MTKAKKGLGKGLSALIPEKKLEIQDIKSDEESIRQIDISKIAPNPNQPRKNFDPKKMKALVESIQAHGIIQPIVVCLTEKGYEIVAGERRWKAAKQAGLKKIPCIIKDINERQQMEIALIENIQREDLNPIEEASAYKILIENYQLTQEQISTAIGKSRSYIANTIRLLNLSEKVKYMVIECQLTSGHARALLRIQDTKIQEEFANQIIQKQLSVRETEELVAQLDENKENIKKKEQRKKQKDDYLISIEDMLKTALGTKVNIVKGKKKGKIEIEYYSNDELERLIELLKEMPTANLS